MSSTQVPLPPEGQEESQERPPRERRSRDRYGRDRRERNEPSVEGQDGIAKTEAFVPNEVQVHEERAPAAPELLAPVSVPEATPVSPTPAPEALALKPAEVAVVAVTEPVQKLVDAPAPAPATAPAPAPKPAPVCASAPSASALPKVQAYDLPLQDLAQVAESSGLQWVNSDATKIAEAKAAIAAEIKPVQIPRERPAPVVLEEAPLVLVETKRDLSSMPLPFEKSADKAAE